MLQRRRLHKAVQQSVVCTSDIGTEECAAGDLRLRIQRVRTGSCLSSIRFCLQAFRGEAAETPGTHPKLAYPEEQKQEIHDTQQ